MKKTVEKNIEDIIALTPTQEGMLFHYLKDPAGNQYSEQLCLNISGEIDIRWFEKAWDVVTKTNEMLRTQFRWKKLEKPAQIILKEHKCDLHIYDLTDKNNRQKKAALEEIKARDRQKTLDLARVPFRVSLCRIAGNKYRLIISNHHILYDGWSTGIILKEFFNAYHALASGNQPVTPLAKPSFKEFIRWRQSQDKTNRERFWKEYLAGFDNPTALPIKKRRKEAGEIKGSGRYTVSLPRSTKDRLEVFLKQHRATMASFFYSTWGILLQRYCNTEEVIFGTTVSGRSAPIKGLQDMVGLFINTIPLRIKTGIGETIKDLLCHVNDSLSIREKYESTPLVDIKEYSQVANHVDLFDSLVVMENYPLDQSLMRKDSRLPLVVESYSIVESTHYDLGISITIGEVIGIDFIYNPNSLEESSISRLSSHFNNIIEYILIDPGNEIFQIEMLSAEEKKQVLYDFNDTEAAYPQNKTIHGIFAGQVEKTPDHTALVGKEEGLKDRRVEGKKEEGEKGRRGEGKKEGENNLRAKSQELRAITYKELDEQSHQLAQQLKAKGVTADTIVGLMFERSPEMIISIMGILKAGGAYLPIDPDYPEQRVQYMLKDSNAKILLKDNDFTPEAFNKRPKGTSVPPSTLPSFPPSNPTNLAYIIYTSGSTGNPKGVLVEHSSVVNLAYSQKVQFDINENDRVLQFSTICFDASVEQIFITLFSGAVLVLIDKNTLLDPHEFDAFMSRHSITHIHAVPSFLSNMKLTAASISTLKRVIAGGDICPVELARTWSRYCDFYNEYGPTETTVTSIEMLVKTVDEGLPLLPIGKPLNNTTAYLLDRWMKVVPLGAVGELYLGGKGVARGYLNRPELTSEKFYLQLPGALFEKTAPGPGKNFLLNTSQYPNTPIPHSPIYMTGDLARWLPDGNMEFLGRMDHQVKIRGFRIELEEIENQLLAHHQVKEAVVTARQDHVGDEYLAAYIVPVSTELTDPEKMDELRKHLSLKLPGYMVPSHFVILERIPRAHSGKVDRKALPEPGITSKKAYVAPGTETERVLAALWSKVLGIQKEKISVNDNFFELGGHSLKAFEVLARVHKTFDIQVPLSFIFDFPTAREFAHALQQREESRYRSIAPVEDKEYYPLSSAQKRLFVLQRLAPGQTVYNISGILHLEGNIEREVMDRCFHRLISRHESLRTSFWLMENEPVQRVHDEVEFEIEYYNKEEVKVKVEVEEGIEEGRVEGGKGRRVEEKEAPLNCQGRGEVSSPIEIETIIREFIRPFDLSQAPLLRVGLIKLLHTPMALRSHPSQEGRSILIVDMHHIISDGISNGILVKEFMALAGEETLSDLKLQYKDYSEWQKDEKQREALKKQENYWKRQFVDEIQVLDLPTDFPRPAVQSFEGSFVTFETGKETTAALKSLAQAEGTTLYMVLLAIYNIFLLKLSSQEEIIVGTPTAGRRHADLGPIIGMFVNTLVLRNYPNGEKSFLTFLKEIKERTLEAFDHQDYPYEDLVNQVLAARDPSRNPLFDTMLVLQDTGVPVIRAAGLRLIPLDYQASTAKFDLMLIAEEREEKLVCIFEYSTRLFTADTIQRFVGYFNKIVDSIIEDPTVKLAEIEIISAQEKQQILEEFSHIQGEYPGDKTILRLFAEQVERTPNHAALEGHSAGRRAQCANEERSALCAVRCAITYRELNESSKRLAYLLRERGVKAGMLVGMMVNRSLEMIVGILGILKTGSGYVPLDPSAPAARKKYILDECNVGILLTTAKFQDKTEVEEKFIETMTIDISPHLSSPASTLTSTSTCQVSTADLAYVIFTSGSMGKPKGVPITHANICPLLHWGYRHLGLNHHDHVLQNLSYYFDWSVWEIFITLTSGAGLYITAEEVLLNPAACLEFILKNDITVLHITPTQFEATAKAAIDSRQTLKTLKHLYIGAEKLTYHLVESTLALIKEDCRLFNMYGPTEASIMSAVLEIHKSDYYRYKEISGIPIGKPIANAHLLVLSKGLNICPVNITGELYISGDGLTSGYLNQPELTAEKFIKISTESHRFYMSYRSSRSYIYKSGDLVRWLPDGNIEFLGRIDLQVKLRGYRIELGEIEKRLLTHKKIKQSAVMVLEKGDGSSADKYLCAYLVADKDIDTVEVKKYLSRELPDYMVPPYFVILERLPINPNGKIDRRALPLPGYGEAVGTTGEGRKPVPPQDHFQEALLRLWREVLPLESSLADVLGIDDSFFHFGGDSLKAVLLVSKVHKAFDVKMPLWQVFRKPTTREMAQYIENAGKEWFASIKAQEKKEYYSLSSGQKRLSFLQQLDPQGIGYNMPMVFRLTGEVDKEKLADTFKQLIRRHESLRTSFPVIEGKSVQRIHDQVEFGIENKEVEVKVEVEEGIEEGRVEGWKGRRVEEKIACGEGKVERSLLNCQGRGEVSSPIGIETIIREFIRPFDLSQAPLLRVGLMNLPPTPAAPRSHPSQEGTSILMVDMHHIISDAVSLDIFTRDFMALYAGEVLPGLRIDYKDYSQWQNSKKNREKIGRQEGFWLNEFAGEIPVLDLPTDYARPAMQSIEGKQLEFRLDDKKTGALKKMALEENVTIYIVLMSVFNILLAKLSGQEDIVVGSPLAGRRHADLERIIGMFVNTLPLRNHPSGEKTFTEFLKEVRKRTLTALENQDYQFEDLVEKLAINRDLSRNPLFDVMLVLQNAEISKLDIPGLNLRPYEYDTGTSKFDLTFNGAELDGELVFKVKFCVKLFLENTTRRFVEYFNTIVSNVLENRDIRIEDIGILSEEEQRLLLCDFNDTAAPYPEQQTVHRLFEARGEQVPDHVAVIGQISNSETQIPTQISITYHQLNQESNHLAYVLKEKGVIPDTIVGIMVERSIKMITGLLGILKAGGAYLPIGVDYPEQRVQYMLKDSNAQVLVVDDTTCASWLSFAPKALLNLSEGHHLNFPASQLPSFPASLPSTLAYIMYTSGSTGRPRGVMVQHGNVVNVVCWWADRYLKPPGTHVLLMSEYTFDPSVNQVFSTLLHGAVLYIVDKMLLGNIDGLRRYIETHHIHVVNFVPTILKDLLARGKKLETVRVVLSGGERLDDGVKNRLIEKGYALYNQYGPTETTIDALVEKCSPAKVTLGRPIYNIKCYVLDKHNHLTPVGVVGELYIGGVGVARGYLNQPGLTSERFLFDFYRSNRSYRSYIISKKLYKTGDLGRWLPDGNIEFLGRADHQVKIRGLRIELGEIESRLLRCKGIAEAVVIDIDRAPGGGGEDKYLCAYIVSAHRCGKVEIGELREELAADLPIYMVPGYFVFLDKIPLTPNGKVDQRALPLPWYGEAEGTTREGRKPVPPQNHFQETLLRLWREVLPLENFPAEVMGIDDSFFHFGGDSLKAVLLVSKVHKVFDVKMPLWEVFRRPTTREMARYIENAVKEWFATIEAQEKKEYYSLSSAQKRLSFLQQLDPQGIGYNMPMVFGMTGEIDKEKLADTFRQLIRRHESLRTSFPVIEGESVQRIHDQVEFGIENKEVEVKVEVEEGIEEGRVEGWKGRRVEEKEESFGRVSDASGGHNPKSQELRAKSYISSFIRPFDLSQAPLLRVGLMNLPPTPAALRSHPSQEGISILMVDMHHIISDAISLDIFTRNFMALYAGEVLPGLRIYYKDYSQWQNSKKNREKVGRQEYFWLSEFAGEIPVLDLPTDHPRSVVQRFAGKHLDFQLDNEKTRALKELAWEEDATIFMVLMSLFNILLSKISGQEDIVVGAPVAGRRHVDLEQVIGMFVNTLALRNYPAGEKPFSVFLREVKKRTLAALENQDYQFEDLVERVVVNRDLSRNPLFDVMLVLQNVGIVEIDIPGVKLRHIEYDPGIAKFDLSFVVEEVEEQLTFTVEFSTVLFLPTTIEKFIDYFKKLVSSVSNHKNIRIGEIEIVTEEERRQLLYGFNDTASWYPKELTIHQLFETQVERTPGRVALVGKKEVGKVLYASGENSLRAKSQELRAITYKELNVNANQLARQLREKGVEPDTIVGIKMERSIELIIGLLGILKAGGAYLPIDPDSPEERIKYMLKDSNVQVLVVDDTSCASWLSFAPEVLLNLSEGHHLNFPASQLPSFPASLPSSLAYIIYTSGSTGRPKGVMVQHGNVVNVVSWWADRYLGQPATHVLLMSDYTFDPSVNQIFSTLLHGAILYIVDKMLLGNNEELRQYIQTHHIHVVNFVPTLLKDLLGSGNKLESIRVVLSGGERLDDGIKDRIIEKGYVLYNQYGPTETTIDALVEKCSTAKVTLGQPIDNVRCYILDKHGNLTPFGIVGELYIGGAGVARGYLNQPVLTSERFLVDFYRSNRSYRTHISKKLYRTGDLARWLPEGNIEFFGRMDYQVKIRGFRIEIKEIEKLLSANENVSEAVVISRDDGAGSNYLCGYVVLTPGEKLDPKALKTYLSQALPNYMIPSFFVQLEKIPLTANGKVDRKALPVPAVSSDRDYVPPQNEIEVTLVDIWSEILGLDKGAVGIHDDFFQLGGHSLKVMALVSRLHKEFQVKVPLLEVFQSTTIRELAKRVKSMKTDTYSSIRMLEQKEFYPAAYSQKRLWLLNQDNPRSAAFNMAGVIALDFDVDILLVKKVLNRITRRHDSFRTGFKVISNQLVQVIKKEMEIPFKMEDLSSLQQPGKENKKQEIYSRELEAPFDLQQMPLSRAALLKLADRKYELLFNIHHIISDGWSIEILKLEFNTLYDAYKKGSPGDIDMQPLGLQYKDYAGWQNQLLANEEKMAEAKEFWKDYLAGPLPVLNLPYDFTHYSGRTASSAYRWVVPESLVNRLRKLAVDHHASLFMVLMAGFSTLLSQVTAQEDIILAIPAAARQHDALKNIVGLFVNTLILRCKINGEESFMDFFKHFRDNAFKILDHQDIPLELIFSQLKIKYPAISVFFNMINIGSTHLQTLTHLESRHAEKVQDAKFDMVCYVTEYKNGIEINCHYFKDRFKPRSIEKLMDFYKKTLESICDGPGKKLKEYRFTTKRKTLKRHN